MEQSMVLFQGVNVVKNASEDLGEDMFNYLSDNVDDIGIYIFNDGETTEDIIDEFDDTISEATEQAGVSNLVAIIPELITRNDPLDDVLSYNEISRGFIDVDHVNTYIVIFTDNEEVIRSCDNIIDGANLYGTIDEIELSDE